MNVEVVSSFASGGTKDADDVALVQIAKKPRSSPDPWAKDFPMETTACTLGTEGSSCTKIMATREYSDGSKFHGYPSIPILSLARRRFQMFPRYQPLLPDNDNDYAFI